MRREADGSTAEVWTYKLFAVFQGERLRNGRRRGKRKADINTEFGPSLYRDGMWEIKHFVSTCGRKFSNVKYLYIFIQNQGWLLESILIKYSRLKNIWLILNMKWISYPGLKKYKWSKRSVIGFRETWQTEQED